ncbi:hypothetical protein OKW40_003676 [Paraburkholderia sp. RAU6.4a]|uniref:hypothetical protein n=1 Tax=Paraburkholderia sp. RAU6.4a TaxID=2991067 RepID=UPI003D1C59BE
MTEVPTDLLAWMLMQAVPPGESYRKAKFLDGDYTAEVWRCSFKDRATVEIDWRRELADKSLLTEPKNRELLDSFRMLLCVQEHPDVCGSCLRSPVTVYNNVRYAMGIIDYLLLNDATLKLHESALGALTENDVKVMLSALASSSSVAESVYHWSEKLTEFLRAAIDTITWDDICAAIRDEPGITEIDVPESDRHTMLTDKELIYARFWLKREHAFIPVNERLPYAIRPNTAILGRFIFGRKTIAGAVRRDTPEELCWGTKDSYFCECARLPVQAQPKERDGYCTEAKMKDYLRVLKCLKLVSAAGGKLPKATIPKAALRALSTADPARLVAEALKEPGHYIIPPTLIMRTAFKAGIKLFLRHADHILSSYLAVVRQSKLAKIAVRKFASPANVSALIAARTRSVGVKCWSLAHHMGKGGPGNRRRKNRSSKESFFARMRRNEGLVELTQIMIGACLCVVGITTARRQGEVMDLAGTDCIDERNELLVFKNRKTGYGGVQDLAARPLHPLAIRIIRKIQAFHASLLECGALAEMPNVFSSPTCDGACVISHTSMNRLLDRFIDYIELPLAKDGTRMYMRQHQLRRYFATDFYRRRAGSIEALTWYFGHTREEQIEAYIDALFCREERARIEAHAAVECLMEKSDTAYESLRDVIEQKFGTRNVEIEEAEAIEAYLFRRQSESGFRLSQERLDVPNNGRLVVYAMMKS